MRWRGMNFTDVATQMTNKSGLLEITQLQGKLNGGQVSLPGTLEEDDRDENSSHDFGKDLIPKITEARSEERRVGKECLRLCRSRWSPYH